MVGALETLVGASWHLRGWRIVVGAYLTPYLGGSWLGHLHSTEPLHISLHISADRGCRLEAWKHWLAHRLEAWRWHSRHIAWRLGGGIVATSLGGLEVASRQHGRVHLCDGDSSGARAAGGLAAAKQRAAAAAAGHDAYSARNADSAAAAAAAVADDDAAAASVVDDAAAAAQRAAAATAAATTCASGHESCSGCSLSNA